MTLTACFSHTPAVSRDLLTAWLLGPRPPAVPPFPASITLAHKDSSQLTAELVDQSEVIPGQPQPPGQRSRVPQAHAKTRTTAASWQLGFLSPGGKEWKNPSPDRKRLNDWAVFVLPEPLGHPCMALPGNCKSEPHCMWGWRDSPGSHQVSGQVPDHCYDHALQTTTLWFGSIRQQVICG